jgi:oxygen-independent coproporphyrinogen-3 oxidase
MRIFFGGGTPSLASPKFISTIIAEARKLWGLTKDCEISMEANPTSVEAKKLEAFKKAGINRISLGIQSLIDADLKKLGRQHTAKEAREAIKIAKKVFGKHYSIDLIYTRPNQKISDWKKELAEAIKLSPYHMSLYQLTIEGGTKFGSMYDVGNLEMPDDDTSADFYEITNEIMEKAGMPAYEVSNYAKPGYECKHNLNYWKSGEYIGIGAGAHSRICTGIAQTDKYKPRLAIEMEKNPKEWMKYVNERGVGFCEAEILTKQEFIEEFLLMGLRLRDGVGNKEFNKYIDENLLEKIDKKKLKKCIKNALIEIDEKSSNIKTTEKGVLVLNSILKELL